VDTINALDLLSIINQNSSQYSDRKLSTAYADLLMKVLLSPNSAMKAYLALLSQGYFAFHVLGLDPGTSRERLDIAKSKFWVLDASVIIPILALGCTSHNYALDLILRIKSLDIKLHTTELLSDEVREHAFWALKKFESESPTSPEFILASSGQARYSPNLFINGYINWSANNGNPSIKNYFKEIIGTDKPYSLDESIKLLLNKHEIEVIGFKDIPNFNQEMLGERDIDLTPEIQDMRETLGTFRSDSQCKAEAEIVVLAKHTDTIFISKSTVLNRIFDRSKSFTWKPEAIYRYLALFTDVQPDEDMLFMSMSDDFHSAGITIVDSDSLARFAAPSIRQSRMKFEAEKEFFEESLGPERFNELIDNFESTPDELKPFYSLQLLFHIATQEQKRRITAEKITEKVIKVKELTEKERLELEKLKGKKAQKELDRKRKKRRKKSQKKKK